MLEINFEDSREYILCTDDILFKSFPKYSAKAILLMSESITGTKLCAMAILPSRKRKTSIKDLIWIIPLPKDPIRVAVRLKSKKPLKK